jgi:serine/threonine-protein kinase
MIGTTLDGRYRVVSLLGEGGMGKVYLAEHVALEKRMAIKVLHEEYSSQEDLMRRFQQEAIAASRIGQENIVNITDFGRTPKGALFFVMEALDGESLASVIHRQGALPDVRTLPILEQICRALASSHARGIIHRDLKPENVMLLQREDRPDFVKVLDFGISKVISRDRPEEQLTRLGMIMGTPEYMAPEQATGSKVDLRVDIYSLGVMAYEMVTGHLPFTGKAPIEILIKHQSTPPKPPREQRPDLDIPRDVEALVLHCMAKKPEARPQDMTQVIWAISEALSRRGLRPLGSVPPRVLAPTVAAQGAGLTTQGRAALGNARPRRVILRALAAALALGAATAMFRSSEKWMLKPAALVAPPPPEIAPAAPTPAQPEPKRTREVMLQSVPAGAAVFEGPTRIGTTPVQVKIALDAAPTYQFKLPGYLPARYQVTTGDSSIRVVLGKAAAKRRAGATKNDNPTKDEDGLKDNPFR